MKKRNEEGYVLAYVMVIILVVCSIAVALMSYSLNTIKTQENMVQRMKAKYEAMGEIERVVAELEYALSKYNPQNTGDGNEDSALAYCSEILKRYSLIDDIESDSTNYTLTESDDQSYTYERSLEITSSSGTVAVVATIDVLINVSIQDLTEYATDEFGQIMNNLDGQLTPISPSQYAYTLDLISWNFTDYVISTHTDGQEVVA